MASNTKSSRGLGGSSGLERAYNTSSVSNLYTKPTGERVRNVRTLACPLAESGKMSVSLSAGPIISVVSPSRAKPKREFLRDPTARDRRDRGINLALKRRALDPRDSIAITDDTLSG